MIRKTLDYAIIMAVGNVPTRPPGVKNEQCDARDKRLE